MEPTTPTQSTATQTTATEPTKPPPPDPGSRFDFEPKEWARSPASGVALALVIATALAFDLVFHSSVASMAGLLAALGCGAVVLSTTSELSPKLYGALGLVFLLSTNLVLRNSPWVIAPTTLALGAFVFIAASAHVYTSQVFVVLRVGFRWLENLLLSSIPWLAEPVVEATKRDSIQLKSVVRGGAIAAAIGALLMLLLAAADSVFAALLGKLFDWSVWSHLLMSALFVVLVGAIGSTASSSAPFPEEERKWGRIGLEGFMGLVSINVVLATWCATQLFVALGHADQILTTEGLTRADYARRGFFELVAVAIIVVSLLNLLDRFTTRHSKKANQLFVGLGVLAVVETIILVAITYSRLDFYMDAFGLTMLRLSVACFLGWLAVVLLLLGARLAGVKKSTNWMSTASLVLAALTTVGFGWANPEAIVANFNLDRSESIQLDTQYLSTLSTDAYPVLADAVNQVDPEASRSLRSQICRAEPNENSYGVFGWNWSRSQAELAQLKLEC